LAENAIRPAGFRIAPRPVAAVETGRRVGRSSLAERLLLLGVILYLVVPANLLVTVGIPYNVPGGSLLLKFHPASYLILLAFMLLLKDAAERRRLSLAMQELPILGVYPIVLIVVMAYTTARFGPSGVGFYIDTFFIAAVLGLVLSTRSDAVNRRMFIWIVILTTLGSVLALVESATQWRMLPYLLDGEPAKEDFFRSAALSAHPLEGAQRTLVVLFSAWVLPQAYRAPVMALLFLSLLAYGSRTAFVIAGAFLALGGLVLVIRSALARQLNPRWLLIGMLMGTILVTSSIFLAWRLDLGTRIFEKLYIDDSAVSRLASIQLLEELDPEQLLLGAGADGVTALMLARRGWFNIENFWIVLLIQLGVFMFLILAPALLGFFYRLAWRGPPAVRLAALVYLVAASSNDALSHKTPNLALVVAIFAGASAIPRGTAPQPAMPMSRTPATVLRKLRARSNATKEEESP